MTPEQSTLQIRRARQLAARIVTPGCVIRSLGEREQIAETLTQLALEVERLGEMRL